MRDKFPIITVGMRTHNVDSDKIMAEDVSFPHDTNPHNTRTFIIGHAHGAICAINATWEGEAWDIAADAKLLSAFELDEVEDKDLITEDTQRLGNFGKPFDLTDSWVEVAIMDRSQDFELMLRLAEARGAGQRFLA